ncbi:hypothetical protein HY468_06035 [Candidatus Roizmanbacteria bacterium]|nr:hypothetical protein [Candidatus Roizmanbacteria bacterium]
MTRESLQQVAQWSEVKPEEPDIPMWDITPWPPEATGRTIIITPEDFPKLLTAEPDKAGHVTMSFLTPQITLEAIEQAKPTIGAMMLRQRGVRYPMRYSAPEEVVRRASPTDALSGVTQGSLLKAIETHDEKRTQDLLNMPDLPFAIPDLRYPESKGQAERTVNYVLAYLLSVNPDARAMFPTSAEVEQYITDNGGVFYPALLRDGFEELVRKPSVASLIEKNALHGGLTSFYQDITVWLTELALSRISHTTQNVPLTTEFPFIPNEDPRTYPDIRFGPHLLLMAGMYAHNLPQNIPDGRKYELIDILKGVDFTRRFIHRMAAVTLLEGTEINTEDVFKLPHDLSGIQKLVERPDISQEKKIAVSQVYQQITEVDNYVNFVLNYLVRNQPVLDKTKGKSTKQSRGGIPSIGGYQNTILQHTGSSNLYTLFRRFKTMAGTRQ